MVRLVLLGPPGAGKGTQAERLATELDIAHVSTGEILRQAVADGTPLGQKAKTIMESGQLVSDEIMLGIIRDRLVQADCEKGFILDGYPRTIPQAQALDTLLLDTPAAEEASSPVVIANMELDQEELVRRIAGRRSCPGCSAVYNVHGHGPRQENVCDACGSRLLQRADDHEDTVRERLKVYDAQTRPLLEYYQTRLVILDAQGTPSDVYQRVKEAVLLQVQQAGGEAP